MRSFRGLEYCSKSPRRSEERQLAIQPFCSHFLGVLRHLGIIFGIFEEFRRPFTVGPCGVGLLVY